MFNPLLIVFTESMTDLMQYIEYTSEAVTKNNM
jgi:hypothetical protein